MNGFSQVPVAWQCVIFALAAIVFGYLVAGVVGKIMEGRKWCIKIAQGCTTAGLTDLAAFFTDLGTGDLIDADKQAIKWAADMNDPAKRMALLAQAVEDSVQYVAANDLTVATKLLAILKAGPLSKTLFAAPPA
jgi:F0F1-type ATP synthase membrane subunit b/b'